MDFASIHQPWLGRYYPPDHRIMFTEKSLGERDASFVALLRRRAREDPERAAYTFLADGDVERGTLTYGEVDRRARAIAATLQSLGLAGERALLLFPPGLDYVEAFFGCLYAGVIAVPAYPPRRNRSLERIRAITADARAAVVLSTRMAGLAVERLADQMPGLHGVRCLFSDQFPEQAAEAWHEPAPSGESLAFLQYTSGSTAMPRGVMLTHDNLLHNCYWVERRFEHTPESIGVIWLPPYHDMGLVGGLLQPLYVGLHCYLMSPVSVFSSPFAWLQAISRYRATTSGGPNFAYDLCVRRITREQRAMLDLSCWQVAFCGAEPVRAETLERFSEMFAPCGFRREVLYPCYGLAEATVMVSGGKKNTPFRCLSVRKAPLEANHVVPCSSTEPGNVALVGCGHTFDDQRIITVHPERRTRCAPGQVGEIWVAGPSIARGYWDKPEDSRQALEARLADTGEGPYLRTGDLGFLDEGELFITGRLKDLIILCGRNLYPQDLERTAERSHPDLQPGCGAAFSIEEDGQERLVIACEAMPRRHPEVDQVAEAVRQAVIEEHEADLYAFVLLKPSGIPRTSSGKIQRHVCRSAFVSGTLEMVGQWRAAGAPSADGLTRTAVLALPAHERRKWLEAYVRKHLARMVRLDPAAVDLHQSVTTLGLDSLRIVELKNALEGCLGITVSVSSFLQGASIAQLVSDVLQELSAPAAVSDSQSMSKLLHEIQQLSSEQVTRLLDADKVATGGTLP
jgi:acyl-CoA synthetase (AMP-forming)/AMP-acid ligase II/acyl carrier protein